MPATLVSGMCRLRGWAASPMVCWTLSLLGWAWPSFLMLLRLLLPAALGAPLSPPYCHTSPPLLLRPDVPLYVSRPPPIINNEPVPTWPCYATNIATQETHQCCQIIRFSFGQNNTQPSPRKRFYFNGASYGHLIFSSKKSCVVVDVFKGVTVSTPQIPDFSSTELYYGALTAPPASPNAHLIIDTGSSNLFWRVGSQSWVRRSLDDGPIKQIVVFKGKVFGLDSGRRLFRVHLTPQIRIQELPAVDSSMISKWYFSNIWLVVCGDMLLLVALRGRIIVTGETFQVFLLDLSTEPALWLKVDKLDSWAIFISTDKRSQTLSCLNPEVWGGRISNCIYCYNHESKHWTALELGKPLQGDDSTSKFDPNIFIFSGHDSRVQPMWVVPSILSLCRGW